MLRQMQVGLERYCFNNVTTSIILKLLFLLQYNRGRLIEKRWVFGLAVMSFQPPRPIFVLVNRRDQRTLENAIQRFVLPGTTVISDEWAAYRQLNRLGYDHQTVNHSVSYVNPATGEYVESYNYHKCKHLDLTGG